MPQPDPRIFNELLRCKGTLLCMTKGGWDGHVQKTCEKFMEGGPRTTFFTYIFNKIYYTRFHVLLKGMLIN